MASIRGAGNRLFRSCVYLRHLEQGQEGSWYAYVRSTLNGILGSNLSFICHGVYRKAFRYLRKVFQAIIKLAKSGAQLIIINQLSVLGCRVLGSGLSISFVSTLFRGENSSD